MWDTLHNFIMLATPAEGCQVEAVIVKAEKVRVEAEKLEEGGEELLSSPEKRVLVLAQVYSSCLEDQVFV